MKKISVIISCYNEEKNIPLLYNRLLKIFKKIPYSYEFIYIDNDSADSSLKILEKIAKKDKRVKVIGMSRNFGSPQPSFIAGLTYSTGSCTVLLHGDIQDPPELIPQFLEKWNKGYQVVYGIHSQRKGESTFMNSMYNMFYSLLHKLSYIDIPRDAGDFSLISREVIPSLLSMKEYDYYLRGLRAYAGFKQVGITYVRDKRIHGKTNTNFFLNVWWAKTIIINFSIKPLEWIAKCALVLIGITILFLLATLLHSYITHTSISPMSIILFVVLFMGSLQLCGLAIIAEYLAKVFLEVKGRPRYIIKTSFNIPKHILKN